MHIALSYRLLAVAAVSLVLGSALAHGSVFRTKSLQIEIDDGGLIQSLRDTVNGKERLLADPSSVLLRLKTFDADTHAVPQRVALRQKSGRQVLLLSYPGGLRAMVDVVEHEGYVTFELAAVSDVDAVDAVQWGPFHVAINETVGTSVGVARNDAYAFGIQALNIKTIGGYAAGTRNRFGNVAEAVEGGSRLQAYSLNRSKPRRVDYAKDLGIHALPIEGETVVGSKIALFGCRPDRVLPTIGTIETEQGLPHPTWKGEWIKTAAYANSTKFIITFGERDIDACIKIARQAGVKCIYHRGPFLSWGHFRLKKSLFPRGTAGMRTCVDKARKAGITIGTHTLSNFIHPFDPYVSPVPHKNLAVMGLTTLAADLDTKARTIRLADTTPAESYEVAPAKNKQYQPLKTIRIGNELISYTSISKTRPWTLRGCTRGAHGTRVSTHRKGARVAKLLSHGYRVFFPDIELLPEMAGRLADVFNRTGMKRLSFDGHEGCDRTGHPTYAQNIFSQAFFDALKDKEVINNSSELPHYYWHLCSNTSWGEPWGNVFRKGMMSYRFEKMEYLEKNYIPKKMGQYRFSAIRNVEDVEWLLARSAGWDAGFDLYIHPKEVPKKKQLGPRILQTIKLWETARAAGVFTDEQKRLLRDPTREFRLTRDATGWHLKQTAHWDASGPESKASHKPAVRSTELVRYFHDTRSGASISPDYRHRSAQREPGEPTLVAWKYRHAYNPHPLQFILRLPGTAGASVFSPTFAVNNGAAVRIPVTIKPGQYVAVAGDGQAVIYNDRHEKIGAVPVKMPVLLKNLNTINFDYDRQGASEGPEVIVNLRSVPK